MATEPEIQELVIMRMSKIGWSPRVNPSNLAGYGEALTEYYDGLADFSPEDLTKAMDELRDTYKYDRWPLVSVIRDTAARAQIKQPRKYIPPPSKQISTEERQAVHKRVERLKRATESGDFGWDEASDYKRVYGGEE